MSQRSLIQGLVSLVLASLSFIAIVVFLHLTPSSAILWVLAWAGVESLAAFYGLHWGLGRSNGAFLSVFFGGMLLRLASLGVAAGLLTFFRIPPAVPLITLVMAYFVLSMVQLPFIKHELR